MNGFELLDEIPSAFVATGSTPPPFVMLSSTDNPHEEQRALSSALVRRFLTKPLSVDDTVALAEEFGTQ